jgi:8-oxo-dGTP pyrophosphatase MutT (NUDIX family)
LRATAALGFNVELRDRIRANLSHLIDAPPEAPDSYRRASVAIIVTPHESGEAAFLLTRRTSHLRSHAAQQALPGGKAEAGESDEAAARRETKEEIGLSLEQNSLLGRLDRYVTSSRFAISPFVYWCEHRVELKLNPGEVASVRRVPLVDLYTREDLVFLPSETTERPVVRLALGDRFIHAPTAAILFQFREVALAGRYVPVAHFDQPEFARR